MTLTAEFPAQDDERWRMDFADAPLDGSPVWLWVVHRTARYYKDPVAEGYEAPVRAMWIDHNGGGWTWHGLAGSIVKWMPRDDGKDIDGSPQFDRPSHSVPPLRLNRLSDGADASTISPQEASASPPEPRGKA